jgi:hypothetical protein
MDRVKTASQRALLHATAGTAQGQSATRFGRGEMHPADAGSSRRNWQAGGHRGGADPGLDKRHKMSCLPIAEDAIWAKIQWKDLMGISPRRGSGACLLVQTSSGVLHSLRM